MQFSEKATGWKGGIVVPPGFATHRGVARAVGARAVCGVRVTAAKAWCVAVQTRRGGVGTFELE